MKVALYQRVSTDRQNVANQRQALLDYCKAKNYEIVAIYEEAESGSYSESKRPQFLTLLEEASKRKFDAILVWALDRFTREGLYKTLHYLKLLEGYGVGFISYQEQYLNTTSENPLVRDIMLAIMAILAKQERLRGIERQRAFQERARKDIAEKGYYLTKSGKKVDSIGAKLSYPPEVLEQIRHLRETIDPKTGRLMSIYRIAKLLELNPGKVAYAIDKLLPPMEATAQNSGAIISTTLPSTVPPPAQSEPTTNNY
jgi:DNA invertase Pin-like site-specific DNA recombinase